MKTRTPPHPFRTLVALAASAATSSLVWAQSPNAPDPAEIAGSSAPTLPPVTVAGKAERPLNLNGASGTGLRLGPSLRETPASVESISRATMEQRGARTLEEALRCAARWG